jgi:pilus assembly protein CpaC
VLGKFFQSISKNRTNTELIVIVTPEIVTPIPAGAPLPELKYPARFLPANSGIPMHTPDGSSNSNSASADARALPPPPATMPVEQLIKSMQPEQPLVIDTMSSGGGYGSSTGGTSSSMSR